MFKIRVVAFFNVLGKLPNMAAKVGESDEVDSLTRSSTTEQTKDSDTQCGYTAACKPAGLQKCANAKVYLFVVSLCTIVQGRCVKQDI